jgi:energy-converting hydrogenase Eha subunit A
MLDPRIYRAALIPLLFALIIVAFSLENRPAPLRSQLVPAAFDGPRAARMLNNLAQQYPRRRPGSTGDQALARRVTSELQAVLGKVEVRRSVVTDAATVDGERNLVNVEAQVPGSAPGAQVVVVAARDALAPKSAAALSGTAALLEIARAVALSRPRRSVTFASVSGSTGGQAGLRALVKKLERPVDAVLILGDLAGPATTDRLVVGWAAAPGATPLELSRTVATALRAETGLKAASPLARSELARFAWPVTVGQQGPVVAAGIPAVMLSASGELPPAADASVDATRLQGFGRATLRTLTALDQGHTIGSESPSLDLVITRKVLPLWAIRLLVAVLLLPAMLTAADAFARLRRERSAVSRWVLWVLGVAMPFALAAIFLRALGLFGAIDATAPPAPPGSLPFGTAAAGAVISAVVIFVLAAALARPMINRKLEVSDSSEQPGAALAPVFVASLAALVIWIFNPYAALLLVLPVNIWLLIGARERPLRRRWSTLFVLISFVPVLLVAAIYCEQLALSPAQFAWFALLSLIGGTPPLLAALGWSVVAGAAAAALLRAFHSESAPSQPITVRGPASYAGPGSLGGVESARRR